MSMIPAAVAIVCILSGVMAFVALRYRQAARADLGVVSAQWIAENRLGRPIDGQR